MDKIDVQIYQLNQELERIQDEMDECKLAKRLMEEYYDDYENDCMTISRIIDDLWDGADAQEMRELEDLEFLLREERMHEMNRYEEQMETLKSYQRKLETKEDDIEWKKRDIYNQEKM